MPVKCNKKALVTCEDCQDAGKQCVKQTENADKCAKLGWNPKKGCKTTPPPDCPEEIKTCQDCLALPAMCFKKKVSKDIGSTCKALGWKKNMTCKEVCEKPTNCKACANKPSNKKCVKSHKKACKQLACERDNIA